MYYDAVSNCIKITLLSITILIYLSSKFSYNLNYLIIKAGLAFAESITDFCGTYHWLCARCNNKDCNAHAQGNYIVVWPTYVHYTYYVLWHNHNNFNEHYCTCFLKSFPRVTCRYFYQQLARCLSTYICDWKLASMHTTASTVFTITR